MEVVRKNAGAKIDENYWSNIWDNENLPSPCNPNDKSLNNTVNLRFHEIFTNAFDSFETKNILEIGCAQSQFLPYFAKEFDFKITGLDYSEIGCKKSRTILEKSGVSANIIFGDMFDPSSEMFEQQDIVFSYGLIEHFHDTADALKACSYFLKKDGLIITIIPNFSSTVGYLQKILGKNIYDIHVPLNREQLKTAHENAGFEVKECNYLMFINNGVLNINEIKNSFLLKTLPRFLSISSKIFWILERLFKIRFPPNKFTSPYILCIAYKKDTK